MTLLAIDDNEDNLVVLRALLADSFPDSRFVAARSGEEGIRLARAEAPDVILLDLVMPIMDGFEACRILKSDEELRRIPVIIVTALKTRPEDRVRAFGLGAEAFLAKPIDAAELAALVSSLSRIRASEEALRERNRSLEAALGELGLAYSEMEAFAYSVSHDLRAPLRAIQAFSNYLAEDYGSALEGEGARLLGTIASSAVKMEALIDGLLELSRASVGELRRADVDMEALADSSFHEALADEGAEGRELLLHPLPRASADSLLIRQVWYNIIANAIKYSAGAQRKLIEIGGRREGEECVYFVRDWGVGFDPEYSSKLFGVFQRLHSGQEFTGVGVGLAIVKRIVARHGGRVWAEGAPDEGATFHFSLPVPGGCP